MYQTSLRATSMQVSLEVSSMVSSLKELKNWPFENW